MNKKQSKTYTARPKFHMANTIVVGAGAAGMACAVHLVRFWRAKGVKDAHKRVLVVTGQAGGGASRQSGSDKQTYYKMGTSPRVPDTAEDFARTLTAFGCCHGDTALIEGIGSLRGFYNLVELGVPFPHDADGAFIGYKTDHDPYERATSAGPKTSKFMSECLQAEARRLGVQIIDAQTVAKFITTGKGAAKRIAAMVCVDSNTCQEASRGQRASAKRGGVTLNVFVAENFVLAAGGPGAIYRDSVYPHTQYGIHGAAFEAGLEACNLTESQYGLASIGFRWNVSGTYMQVVPRVFSTDADGRDEREFLTEYFDDMPSMATNIFLKGYQWPFDAQRITGGQSSLIDMAVHQETVVRGRRVWMDFLLNPVGKSGWEPFSLERLRPEAFDYLRKNGAMHPRPIDRLAHMNMPAIEIYAEHKIDLRKEPLEIALCAQHHNGGFAVNAWWESSLSHTFVIGEMAGTHGVKRPGGSALNAGQVGALRAAEYIANAYGRDVPEARIERELSIAVTQAVEELQEIQARGTQRTHIEQPPPAASRGRAAIAPAEAMAEIQDRMTRFGAHLRSHREASAAFQAAKAQYYRLIAEGLNVTGVNGLAQAIRVRQQCLTHVAMLAAICSILERGGGSRGSHCVLADDGIEMHPALIDSATKKPYRFRPENELLRKSILYVRFNPQAEGLFDLRDVPPRPALDRQIAFEAGWTAFREGEIYQ